jgi:hypothetical protein
MFILYNQKITALNSRGRYVSAGLHSEPSPRRLPLNKTVLSLKQNLASSKNYLLFRLLPQFFKFVAFIFSENVISKCPSRSTKNESVPSYLWKP